MIGLTLGRYFFARYIGIALWIFFGLFALIFIIDFTEFSNRTSGLANYSLTAALAASALRVPMLMQQSVPFVGLFAAMAMLISLNRKYELVIARSAGVSAWQFLLPASIGALLFGLATITLLNPIAAHGFRKAELLEAEIRSGHNVADPNSTTTPWLKQTTDEGETIIGANAVVNQGLDLRDAVFFRFNDDGDLVERIDARRAVLREGYWELTQARRRHDGEETESLARIRVKTNLKPEFVQERLARPETIPFFELGQKIDVARSFGLQASAFAMQYHSLIALPFLLVAMTLIAATVSMRFTRLGQSASLILGGIVAGFLLYVVTVLVKAFGSSGVVPPVVAAWFPVALAMFFGVSYILHKEDG